MKAVPNVGACLQAMLQLALTVHVLNRLQAGSYKKSEAGA